MILLTNEEISQAAYERNKLFEEDSTMAYTRKPNADECIAKEQLRKVVGVLKDKTVKAWGGNRVILNEDWEAILKECE